MIKPKLPEPSVESDKRKCQYCGRKHPKNRGTLIHFPSIDYIGVKEITLPDGTVTEPFSVWVYTCQWCRSKETKRKKKEKAYKKALINGTY